MSIFINTRSGECRDISLVSLVPDQVRARSEPNQRPSAGLPNDGFDTLLPPSSARVFILSQSHRQMQNYLWTLWMQLAAPTWKYLWEVKATETNPDFFKSLKPEMVDKKQKWQEKPKKPLLGKAIFTRKFLLHNQIYDGLSVLWWMSKIIGCNNVWLLFSWSKMSNDLCQTSKTSALSLFDALYE